MSNDAIARKLARLQTGAKPRVLDLFAGCGGISIGFESAGFEIGGQSSLIPTPRGLMA